MAIMRLPISLLFLSLLVFSCTDDDPVNPVIDETRVNLMDLKPGQETRYVAYTMICDSTSFAWSGDTLVVQIQGEPGDLKVVEKLTEGSPLAGVWGDSTSYPISSKNGIVTIPERQNSMLFTFYGSDTIHLQPSNRVNLEQEDCYISYGSGLFKGDEIGRIEHFDFGPITISDKTAVSCVPAVDVDAYLIYNPNELYMSHQVYTTTFWGNPIAKGTVYGWVMVE